MSGLTVGKYEVIAPKHCNQSSSNSHLWSNAEHQRCEDGLYSFVICLNKNCQAYERLRIDK